MTRDCPECGSGRVRIEGGCPTCGECGWGKCGGRRLVTDGGREVALWRRDEDRWTGRRASYLKRSYSLDETVAEALAWSELGYSSYGIAERVGKTEPTIKAYLDDVEERFGKAAAFSRGASDLAVDADLPTSGGGGS